MKILWCLLLVCGSASLAAASTEEEPQDMLQVVSPEYREMARLFLDLSTVAFPSLSEKLNLTTSVATLAITDPIQNIMFGIGNLMDFFSDVSSGTLPSFSPLTLGNIALPSISLNLTNPFAGVDFSNLNGIDLTPLFSGLGIDLSSLNFGDFGTLGALAVGSAGFVTVLSAIVVSILSAGVYGLEIANFILAIISLAYLGIFLGSGQGDIQTLLGTDFGLSEVTGFLRSDIDYYDTYSSYSEYAAQARSLYESSSVLQELGQWIYDYGMSFFQ